ncbi:MAG: phytoene/squalene synthase family protein [Candidatus Micrarchaeota archaeon]|nr:phytoene/squalene synthase family protein [Candidatus Micrarchaeota archaeon]
MSATAYDFEACKEVLQKGSKTFFLSSKLLPAAKKKAFWAVYAFCRKSDDIIDEGNIPARKRLEMLRKWEKELLGAYAGKPSKHPVIRAFVSVAKEFSIPKSYPLTLIRGVSSDLYRQRFSTFQQLRAYCFSVASIVGLMLLRVMGINSAKARKKAVYLGIAMQLTNIIRDVAEDFSAGRVYLPASDLRRFGLSYSDLGPKMQKGKKRAFIKLIEFECKRARKYYRLSLSGIRLLPKELQIAITTASLLYSSILDKIERSGFDVFKQQRLSSSFT